MTNKILRYIILTTVWLMISIQAIAAPGDPPVDDDPVDPAPIDTWMILLVLGGVVLGIYWIFQSKKRTII